MAEYPTGDPTIATVETEVALLMRRGEATRRAAPADLHPALDRAAYLLLRRLAQTGPQNVNALADALSLDGSTVTRQVAVLVRDGLATRHRDPSDGRSILVAPTPAGRSRMEAVRTARHAVYATVLADWSDDDRAALANLLGRLNHDLDRFTRHQLAPRPPARP
jgi:DNA-binding MarR family transcriptional regulator